MGFLLFICFTLDTLSLNGFRYTWYIDWWPGSLSPSPNRILPTLDDVVKVPIILSQIAKAEPKLRSKCSGLLLWCTWCFACKGSNSQTSLSNSLFYYGVVCCARRSFVCVTACALDSYSGKSDEHRTAWVETSLLQLVNAN